MTFKQASFTCFFCVVCIFSSGCKKDKKGTGAPNVKDPAEVVATRKKIVYLVKGTNFRLNIIDSNSVFKRDLYFKDSLRYTFYKGSGASIGMSVFNQTIKDSIYTWEISINGKVQANAFSPGGAYFMVPYGN